MTTAVADSVGGAATPNIELCRARFAVAVAAESLADVCRSASSTPAEVAAAERRVSDAFAAYGGLVLASRSQN